MYVGRWVVGERSDSVHYKDIDETSKPKKFQRFIHFKSVYFKSDQDCYRKCLN